MVANSTLYVVTLNGRRGTEMKILGRNRELWMCLVENQSCFVIIIYFIKYYKVIVTSGAGPRAVGTERGWWSK